MSYINNGVLEPIEGGVCAAKGFLANGIHCGIRKNKAKKDLGLIYSEKKACAAAVYTQNLVKGAPLIVTKDNLTDGYAYAVICNSGNANTCNADGIEIAKKMCASLGNSLDISEKDVVVASTGVIGQPLDVNPIVEAIPSLVAGLGDCSECSDYAAEAIMTTDTKKKDVAYRFEIDGVECRIGGIAKGSGMIHPNMATMLVFVTTDVSISPELLNEALKEDVKTSFNMISVDGDTSTNDMVSVLANGLANNKTITEKGDAFEIFKAALSAVTTDLCRKIAADGEGATKLLECTVKGADKYETAAVCAKSVVCSSLLKAAMFGADANWGRVLCALGYSGADIDVNAVDVSFKSKAGEIEVCKNGAGVAFSEEKAKEILVENEIQILISVGKGEFSATAWGCDLTYDYVKINGDYRT